MPERFQDADLARPFGDLSVYIAKQNNESADRGSDAE
jgi:hypothetical protein